MWKITLYTFYLEKIMKASGLILEEGLKDKIEEGGKQLQQENFMKNRLVVLWIFQQLFQDYPGRPQGHGWFGL